MEKVFGEQSASSIVKEILQSDYYASLDTEKEKETYIGYLNYKVIKAMYELANEGSPQDISWDMCLSVVKHSKVFHDAAVDVLRHTLTEFVNAGDFNFKARTAPVLYDDNEPGEKDGILRSVHFLPADTGCAIIDWFLLRAEIAYYFYLLNMGKKYTWIEYVDTLTQNEEIWSILRTAFQDALGRIDFKERWLTLITEKPELYGISSSEEL